MSLSKAADDRNDPSIGSVIVQIPTDIVGRLGKAPRSSAFCVKNPRYPKIVYVAMLDSVTYSDLLIPKDRGLRRIALNAPSPRSLIVQRQEAPAERHRMRLRRDETSNWPPTTAKKSWRFPQNLHRIYCLHCVPGWLLSQGLCV